MEIDLKNSEERFQKTVTDLEKQTILSRDREQRIHHLTQDVRSLTVLYVRFITYFPLAPYFQLETKEETLSNIRSELETARNMIVQKETQWSALNEKFLDSSVFMLEETIR